MQKFNAADKDKDGKCNASEAADFLKSIFSDEDLAELKDDAHINLWRDACASLTLGTGESISFDDYQRSAEVVKCWMESMKGVDEAIEQFPPEKRKVVKQMMSGGFC